MPNYAIEVISPGPIGPEGPPNVLEVGTVTLGLPTDPLIFDIVGDSPNQVVNVQIPRGFQGIQGIQGIQGNTGPANALDVVSVTALAAGAAPTVVISGAAPNQHLAFGIPAGAQGIQGIQGLKGDKGDPGTGAVSTVNTVMPVAGDVTLTQDNIGDGATYGRITKTERTRLAALAINSASIAAASGYVSGGTDVSVADGGTGRSTSTTAYGVLAAGTTATGAHQTIAPGTSGQFLKSTGASALPAFATMIPSDVGAKKIWVCNATDTLASLVTLGMVTGDLIARRP